MTLVQVFLALSMSSSLSCYMQVLTLKELHTLILICIGQSMNIQQFKFLKPSLTITSVIVQLQI